jgi:hypothetical protein
MLTSTELKMCVIYLHVKSYTKMKHGKNTVLNMIYMFSKLFRAVNVLTMRNL